MNCEAFEERIGPQFGLVHSEVADTFADLKGQGRTQKLGKINDSSEKAATAISIEMLISSGVGRVEGKQKRSSTDTETEDRCNVHGATIHRSLAA